MIGLSLKISHWLIVSGGTQNLSNQSFTVVNVIAVRQHFVPTPCIYFVDNIKPLSTKNHDLRYY